MTADPKRWVRQDMAGLSNEESTALLREYGGEVTAAVRRAHPNDREDYAAVGNIAILEAAITYTPERMCMRAWVARVVRWRIQEYAGQMHSQREDLQYDEDIEEVAGALATYAGLGDTGHAYNVSPEHVAIERNSRDVVRKELSFLAPRNQVLLAAEMEGESTAATARSLGITKQRASEIRTDSIACLRIFMREATE